MHRSPQEGLLLLILVKACDCLSFLFPRFLLTVLTAGSTSHAGQLRLPSMATLRHGERSLKDYYGGKATDRMLMTSSVLGPARYLASLADF